MSHSHGLSRTPEYEIWKNMRRRCESPRHSKFASYGGRGISVCDRWLSFENFISDMGPRPSADHSIERRDNDGHYEPGNCTWETCSRQARNRRDTRFVAYRGERVALRDLCEGHGINIRTVHQRLLNGWTVEAAIEVPVFGPGKRIDRSRASERRAPLSFDRRSPLSPILAQTGEVSAAAAAS